MDEDDFDFYLRIAARTRKKINQNQSNRKYIGKFGVGFLAAFPFCLQYEIESTKRGSDEILYATIPTEQYFTTDNGQLINVSDILITGGVKKNKSVLNKQYTKVSLIGFSKITKQFFNSREAEHSYSIFNYSGLEKLRWQLSDDLPLSYKNSKFNNLIYSDSQLDFKVYVNEVELFREVYGDTILKKNKEPFEQIGSIKFQYFISTNFSPIQPPEARGLKIRNLNVGVGTRTFFGVGIEGRTYASQSNITGEVIVWDGLNDLIALNREDFNFSPEFEDLKKYLRQLITLSANTLEDISDISKISRQSEVTNRLLSLEFLQPLKVQKKLESLGNKGFDVRYVEQLESFKKIEIDKKKKKIYVHGSFEESIKKVKIINKTYDLESSRWDYKKTDLPACKIVNNRIIINENYPLFKGRKYLDVFFKIHILLLINYKNGLIEQSVHQKLLEQVLQLFIDYTK